MSFISSDFAIPVRAFPHRDGTPSIPFSYVSKIMFGVGLGISIPLIAVAFDVDNLGLLITRALQSLIFWKTNHSNSTVRKHVSTEASDTDDDTLKLGRKSEGIDRKNYSYETDNESHIVSRSVGRTLGLPKDGSWRNSIRASKDLERGVAVPRKYEGNHT